MSLARSLVFMATAITVFAKTKLIRSMHFFEIRLSRSRCLCFLLILGLFRIAEFSKQMKKCVPLRLRNRVFRWPDGDAPHSQL